MDLSFLSRSDSLEFSLWNICKISSVLYSFQILYSVIEVDLDFRVFEMKDCGVHM